MTGSTPANHHNSSITNNGSIVSTDHLDFLACHLNINEKFGLTTKALFEFTIFKEI